jgi:hypothetical protein
MKLLSADDVRDIVSQNEELKKYGEKLTQTNVKLQEELTQTKDKLRHLEELAKFNSSPLAIGSSEEDVCRIEIGRYYNLVKTRPLEFNEVKSFEIYVKSLMLIRGKAAVEDKQTKKPQQLSEDQLLQLALQVVDDTNEQ